MPAVAAAGNDPGTEDPDPDADRITLDATPLTPPSAGGDGKKRKRLKQLGRNMKSAAKKRAADGKDNVLSRLGGGTTATTRRH